MDKAALIAAGSSFAASCVVYNVWDQKQQFYPTVVHISKSSSCMAVFYVQAFSIVYLLAHIFRKVFFGTLRAAETEHLIERSWYALTETCLAFTVFRDDLSPSFIAQFVILLFLKAFHWLLEDRIDFMERSPVIGFFFHVRALSLMSILAVADAFCLSYAAHVTLQKGATVHLVFGFEYFVLVLLVATILVKYILHLIDLRHESQWANKTIYLLYTELVIGAVKVLMYAIFVTIMIRVHTFPLFVIRPMYLALRQFQKTLVDVVKSRKATYNMRERYPDATAEEIASGDNTCIICREEMVTAKKLPCGHIFHLECLRSWLLRQQTCPTCRIDILQQQQQQQNQQNQQNQQQNRNNVPPGFPGGAVPPPLFAWENQANGANPAPGGVPPGGVPPGGVPQSGVPPPGAPHTFGTPRFFIPTSNAQTFSIPGFAMPPPPPSLHNLSVEELMCFEGETRQAIENRLIILKNIQMLMEAVQGQMQLYNSVAGPVPPSFFSFSQGTSRTGPAGPGTIPHAPSSQAPVPTTNPGPSSQAPGLTINPGPSSAAQAPSPPSVSSQSPSSPPAAETAVVPSGKEKAKPAAQTDAEGQVSVSSSSLSDSSDSLREQLRAARLAAFNDAAEGTAQTSDLRKRNVNTENES